MRSDLVFAAIAHVPNRFQLSRLVSIATRALHPPGKRIQDTMNDVLVRYSRANRIAGIKSKQYPVADPLPVERAHRRKDPRVRSVLQRIVTSAIIGAKDLDRLQDNLAAAELTFIRGTPQGPG